MKMRSGSAQESETFLGNFQMAEAVAISRSAGGSVIWRVALGMVGRVVGRRVSRGIALRVTASLIVVPVVVTNVLAHNCRCIVEGGKSPD
jgi:hypothetical protein